MAFEEDGVQWDANQFSLDRFTLVSKPEASPSKALTGHNSIGSLMPGSNNAAAEDKSSGHCQVDDCDADITGMREYHSRYKVCETHLKAQSCIKDGIAQRFCQQCGRFQPVEDFDGPKRSCRARLSKHNARRRRQREMANMLRTTGRIDKEALCAKYDISMEDLDKKLVKIQKPSMKRKGARGGGTTSADSSGMSSGSGASGGAPFAMDTLLGTAGSMPPITQAELDLLGDSFLEEVLGPLGLPGLAPFDGSTSLPTGDAAIASGARGGTATDFLSINPANVMDLDDVAVLTELSKELGISPAVGIPSQPATATAAGVDGAGAPLSASTSNGSVATGSGGFTAEANAATRLHQLNQQQQQQRQQHMRMQQSAAAAAAAGFMPPMQAAQAAASFPFVRPTAPTTTSFGPPPGTTTITTGLGVVPPYMRPPTATVGIPVAPAAAGTVTMPLPSQTVAMAPPATAPQSATATATGSAAASVFEGALHMLQYNQSQVQYGGQERLVRLSAKLFGCTPADLPAEVKAPLISMLSNDAVEGYMRPGCVHIEANGMANEHSLEALQSGGIRAALGRFLEQDAGVAVAEGRTMVMQLGDQMAVVKDGKVLHVLSTAHAGDLLPSVAAVRPLALVAPSSSPAAAAADTSVEIQIWGYHLGRENDVVLARSRGKHLQTKIISVEQDAENWGDDRLQCMKVRVSGPLSPGAVHVEVMRGAYCSASRSLLVAPSAEVVEEVRTLECYAAGGDGGDVDTLIYEIGAVLEANAAATAASRVGLLRRLTGGARRASAEHNRVVAEMQQGPAPPGRVARRFVQFALQRRWSAVTKAALDAATYGNVSGKEALQEMEEAAMSAAGLPLLALAVRTQSPELLSAVISWASTNNATLSATAPGYRGLTALHLAALIRDGGATAAALSSACPDALSGWEGARAEDGSTPLGLATQFGTSPDIDRLIARAQVAAGAASLTKAGTALLGNSNPEDYEIIPTRFLSSSKGWNIDNVDADTSDGADSSDHRRFSFEDNDVTLTSTFSKAHSRNPVLVTDAQMNRSLGFASPALESKYAAWYHSGQLPVDLAFTAIVILSQSAWIVRWSMGHSLALLFVMLSLICFNAAYLVTAWLFPKTYIKNREWLCVASMLVHKLAQMATTALPVHGTVYSATYNTTVALLESSSFAQVLMLSMGAKARFAYHMPTLLVLLGLSASLNGSICAAAFGNVSPTMCAPSMLAFQAVACCALPGALVYTLEKRSRHIFLNSAVV